MPEGKTRIPTVDVETLPGRRARSTRGTAQAAKRAALSVPSLRARNPALSFLRIRPWRLICVLWTSGHSLWAVARQVGATVSCVFRWRQAYRRKGPRRLAPKPTPGRPPRLARAENCQLVKLLTRGALYAGYRTDLWTARDRADSPGVRRALSPRARLEGADRLGLELPETRAARSRARRGCHRPMEAGRVAVDKKTPRDVAPISYSSMRAASSSSRMFAGPGHRRGRRPVFVTGIGTIVCPSLVAGGVAPAPAGGPVSAVPGSQSCGPRYPGVPPSSPAPSARTDRPALGSRPNPPSARGPGFPRRASSTPCALLPRVRAKTHSCRVRVGSGRSRPRQRHSR
jgi:hypothetical protein